MKKNSFNGFKSQEQFESITNLLGSQSNEKDIHLYGNAIVIENFYQEGSDVFITKAGVEIYAGKNEWVKIEMLDSICEIREMWQNSEFDFIWEAAQYESR